MRLTDTEIVAGYVLTGFIVLVSLGLIVGFGYAALWLFMSFGGY